MRYWIALLCLTLVAAEDPAVLSERAQQSAQQQRFEEAEQLWKRAIDISPRYFPALFNLGLFYARQQKFVDAELFLKRAATGISNGFQCLVHVGIRALDTRKIRRCASRLEGGAEAPAAKSSIDAGDVGGIL